jgi:hypothetical protein
MHPSSNHNTHSHVVKFALSTGRVCFVLALALIMVGCSVGIPAALRAVTGPGKVAAVDFAVLSATPKPGEAVTCTTSTITQTLCSAKAKGDVAVAAAAAGYSDSLSAYNALLLVPCDKVLTGNLDGVTLAPGVYCFENSAALKGQLTLNGPANGMWVFKIGTKSGTGDLTATNFTVVMSGGGQACNVSWWVAQSVTLTDSIFLGTILAGKAITITGGTYNGYTFAKVAVTLTDVTVTTCKIAVIGVGGSGGTGGTVNLKSKCNQGVGNGPEGCDPGNSNHGDPANSNDENGGTPGNPGRKGGK